MYNFNHLYYFYITAKSGGVNAAATHLRISQPSLSSQLKTLERFLDVRLFHRIGRNNHLTSAGSAIYGLCRHMFEISEEMEELISKQVPSAARRIHIGISNEVDRPFVIEVVNVFLKKHALAQRPKVTVISGPLDQLVERLQFRELDAIVTQSAMIDPELENLTRAEVPIILACSRHRKKTSLSKNTSSLTSLKTIIGEEAHWLMPSSAFKLRAEINHFFDINHIKGRIVFESDVIASLVRSVVDDVGIAFLPLLYVGREIQEKSIQIIGPKKGYWKYRVWLSCHSQHKTDPLISALSSAFKEICNRASS